MTPEEVQELREVMRQTPYSAPSRAADCVALCDSWLLQQKVVDAGRAILRVNNDTGMFSAIQWLRESLSDLDDVSHSVDQSQLLTEDHSEIVLVDADARDVWGKPHREVTYTKEMLAADMEIRRKRPSVLSPAASPDEGETGT